MLRMSAFENNETTKIKYSFVFGIFDCLVFVHTFRTHELTQLQSLTVQMQVYTINSNQKFKRSQKECKRIVTEFRLKYQHTRTRCIGSFLCLEWASMRSGRNGIWFAKIERIRTHISVNSNEILGSFFLLTEKFSANFLPAGFVCLSVLFHLHL